MHQGIRVGAVSYLNAKPLYHRLGEHAPEVSLTMDYPSALADRLSRGDLDVALIPSVEYLRGVGRGYEIIPGFAIAAKGPVRSVRLFSRVPLGQIRRLALDEGSRTSQALCRILLERAWGASPDRVENLPLGTPAEESTADAVMLIGDRAMRDPSGTFAEVVDLAEAWNDWTGLPFVFALWVARSGVDLGDLPEALERSRADGLAHVFEIADEHGPRLGLDRAECLDYLTRVLSYDLGERECAGLRRFAAECAAMGLAPRGADLVFHRERARDLA